MTFTLSQTHLDLFISSFFADEQLPLRGQQRQCHSVHGRQKIQQNCHTGTHNRSLNLSNFSCSALLGFKHIQPARLVGIWGLPWCGVWLWKSSVPCLLSVGSILPSYASFCLLLAASPLEGDQLKPLTSGQI